MQGLYLKIKFNIDFPTTKRERSNIFPAATFLNFMHQMNIPLMKKLFIFFTNSTPQNKTLSGIQQKL